MYRPGLFSEQSRVQLGCVDSLKSESIQSNKHLRVAAVNKYRLQLADDGSFLVCDLFVDENEVG